jgi:hypothetical protein
MDAKIAEAYSHLKQGIAEGTVGKIEAPEND